MTRSWPVAGHERTIHVIGDLHVGGFAGVTDQYDQRILKFRLDMASNYGRTIPSAIATVQVGDFVDNALNSGQFDAAANTFASVLPGNNLYGVIGDHDYAFLDSNTRTPAQAVTAFTSWTNRTANWNAVFEHFKLIGLEPEPVGTTPGGRLATSSATNTYLDTQLGNTTLPCIIVFHCPLANSVLGGVTQYQSDPTTDSGTFAWTNTTAVKAVLNAHSNAKIVLSGHTHTSPDGSVPSLVVGNYSVGSRSVVAINASALAYNGRSISRNDPIKSLFLTYRNTLFGDVVELRWRDHGKGAWSGNGFPRLQTVAVPA